MPKVSVLMPVYKTNEKYLREAISSILNQTFTDFEFLILDDCPDDDREAIVMSYADKRIKYYKNEQNLGITPSRNKLIDIAKGEYLAIFDHDDISHPQRLEKEVLYLDSHPEVGVVSSWIRKIPQNKVSHNPSDNQDIKISLVNHDVVAHSASMIRKSVLVANNIHYEEEYSPSEDYALWCKLLDYTEFYNIPEVLLDYRQHEGNTSKKQQNKMELMTWKIRSLMRVWHPELYYEYEMRTKHVSYVELFGLIPLLKIVTTASRTKIYLFNKIFILKIKRSDRLGDK